MKAIPVGFFAQVDKVQALGQEVWFTYQVGRIVGQVNSVEKFVDNIIASYYAGNNYEVLKSDVIEAMTLDAKISLIKKIAVAVGLGFSRTNKSDLYRWKEIRNTFGACATVSHLYHSTPVMECVTERASQIGHRKIPTNFSSRYLFYLCQMSSILQIVPDRFLLIKMLSDTIEIISLNIIRDHSLSARLNIT